jgi:hypothetical protein
VTGNGSTSLPVAIEVMERGRNVIMYRCINAERVVNLVFLRVGDIQAVISDERSQPA